MAENKSEVIAGAVVLAVALGFVFYAGKLTGASAGGQSYELGASFRSADGITVGTDVRLAGVKVGRVTSMALDPSTYRAGTTISVAEGISVPDDSALAISSEGLLGGNYVEILPGGSPIHFEPGDQIEFTQGSISLVSLLMKFVGGDSGEVPSE
ncbi:phospholipid/cholesterol/gamma-HCH transport system substrate-binding protein [Roseovarius nanhaiticus]|uniref:Phospholipid/cholesterol/gamma-HCH transport system substrate-binding protein n=1 Tax=Roseovarius nanhaiticus TaxID=573024 RepID=A0A1N7FP26_9RHOB|nr:outer membrane lipid asymmetry maintenance protein MlaD [Roseovarius nanhaiticus]SEK49592.1 phospholipid/cholesterol/gamma-HCH transport system substrate-binding protein [Roseovarius nanhaiticus]SIS02015.1 phospholipid/cholesterol/gamma-HCH transport system substrate-binding protein [Roseovarius nanhaiticus]